MANSLVPVSDPIRAMAIATQIQLTQTITQFAGYVDPTGHAATSPKGLAITINRLIKRYYGLGVDEMPRDMLLHAASAKHRASERIERGMQTGESRAAIKQAVHAIIQLSGESYATLKRG